MRALSLLVLPTGLLWAAGTLPKDAPSAYPAHAATPKAAIGAEYLAHTLAAEGRTVPIEDYLVVEVAIFPSGGAIQVSTGAFTLRVNGAKRALFSQTAGLVAAALQHPDWSMRPTVVAEAGAGDAGVTVGRPPASERFPGDPMPGGRRRLPPPPRAPGEENRSGQPSAPVTPPHELVLASALPEGEASKPVAGYLFFAYKGKLKSVKTLELLYEGADGKLAVRLK